MTGNLAAVADFGTLLDFHEGANFHFITDFATVKIRERVNANSLAQLDVGRNSLK
jgi:hypothetical protein